MQAKLKVVDGKASRSEVPLKLPVVIGRSGDAGLKIKHQLISRAHCELFEKDGYLYLRDNGSLNGTFMAGQRITEVLLRPGDQFTVGPLTFEADYDPPATEPLAEPTATVDAQTTMNVAATGPDFSALDDAAADAPLDFPGIDDGPAAGSADATLDFMPGETINEAASSAADEIAWPADTDDAPGTPAAQGGGDGVDMSWLTGDATAEVPAVESEFTEPAVGEEPTPEAEESVSLPEEEPQAEEAFEAAVEEDESAAGDEFESLVADSLAAGVEPPVEETNAEAEPEELLEQPDQAESLDQGLDFSEPATEESAPEDMPEAQQDMPKVPAASGEVDFSWLSAEPSAPTPDAGGPVENNANSDAPDAAWPLNFDESSTPSTESETGFPGIREEKNALQDSLPEAEEIAGKEPPAPPQDNDWMLGLAAQQPDEPSPAPEAASERQGDSIVPTAVSDEPPAEDTGAASEQNDDSNTLDFAALAEANDPPANANDSSPVSLIDTDPMTGLAVPEDSVPEVAVPEVVDALAGELPQEPASAWEEPVVDEGVDQGENDFEALSSLAADSEAALPPLEEEISELADSPEDLVIEPPQEIASAPTGLSVEESLEPAVEAAASEGETADLAFEQPDTPTIDGPQEMDSAVIQPLAEVRKEPAMFHEFGESDAMTADAAGDFQTEGDDAPADLAGIEENPLAAVEGQTVDKPSEEFSLDEPVEQEHVVNEVVSTDSPDVQLPWTEVPPLVDEAADSKSADGAESWNVSEDQTTASDELPIANEEAFSEFPTVATEAAGLEEQEIPLAEPVADSAPEQTDIPSWLEPSPIAFEDEPSHEVASVETTPEEPSTRAESDEPLSDEEQPWQSMPAKPIGFAAGLLPLEPAEEISRPEVPEADATAPTRDDSAALPEQAGEPEAPVAPSWSAAVSHDDGLDEGRTTDTSDLSIANASNESGEFGAGIFDGEEVPSEQIALTNERLPAEEPAPMPIGSEIAAPVFAELPAAAVDSSGFAAAGPPEFFVFGKRSAQSVPVSRRPFEWVAAATTQDEPSAWQPSEQAISAESSEEAWDELAEVGEDAGLALETPATDEQIDSDSSWLEAPAAEGEPWAAPAFASEDHELTDELTNGSADELTGELSAEAPPAEEGSDEATLLWNTPPSEDAVAVETVEEMTDEAASLDLFEPTPVMDEMFPDGAIADPSAIDASALEPSGELPEDAGPIFGESAAEWQSPPDEAGDEVPPSELLDAEPLGELEPLGEIDEWETAEPLAAAEAAAGDAPVDFPDPSAPPAEDDTTSAWTNAPAPADPSSYAAPPPPLPASPAEAVPQAKSRWWWPFGGKKAKPAAKTGGTASRPAAPPPLATALPAVEPTDWQPPEAAPLAMDDDDDNQRVGEGLEMDMSLLAEPELLDDEEFAIPLEEAAPLDLTEAVESATEEQAEWQPAEEAQQPLDMSEDMFAEEPSAEVDPISFDEPEIPREEASTPSTPVADEFVDDWLSAEPQAPAPSDSPASDASPADEPTDDDLDDFLKQLK
ncbi:MAG: FHA domain-containing protein [Pirellulales bacterium]